MKKYIIIIGLLFLTSCAAFHIPVDTVDRPMTAAEAEDFVEYIAWDFLTVLGLALW